MSGIITPSGLVNELTVITDDDTISEVNVPGEAFNRKIKKSVDKTYMQGGIKDGTEQLNPRSFISGRFDSQELVSGTLSGGWITIAEIENAENRGGTADFSFAQTAGRSTYRIKAQFGNSSTAKTHSNTDIEIIGSNNSANNFLGARIAKSDSVSDAGAKLQIKISGGFAFTILMSNNTGRDTGWTIVTPILENTPTLPDGVTAGTFLEAGEELSFDGINVNSFIPGLTVSKASNDQVRCALLWNQIPKQGTVFTIALPTLLPTFHDRLGATATLTGAHTIATFSIEKGTIYFNITEVALFTGLASGNLGLRLTDTGFKFTIT